MIPLAHDIGLQPTDMELVGVLAGLDDPDAAINRRLTPLVYAGDGLIRMHPETEEHGVASSATQVAAPA